MSGTELPRYFVEKRQKGHSLYYWQPGKALLRAGFKTVALGKDLAAAVKQAEAINQKVDQWRGGQPVLASNRHGTLPWVVEAYKSSPAYNNLRRRTTYDCCIRRLLQWSAELGDPPMRTIVRRDVERLWSELKDTPFMAHYVIGLGRLLWTYADDLDEDLVVRNPFKRVKLPPRPPRDQVWKPEQIVAVMKMALTPGPWGRPWGCKAGRDRPFGPRPSVALAVLLAANTAQRRGDILALRWSQYDGRTISLTQSKTGTALTIPVTAELKRALDDELQALAEGNVVPLNAARGREIVVSETTGRRWNSVWFSVAFREIAAAAGIPSDLQFRDLRRTATVQLAEAGCSEAEIAAFGGWSAESVAAMMKVYRPLNVTMAHHGLVKLEEYRSKLQLEA